jgi:polyhydroxyalkanoate synthesis regulator phasin
MDGIFSHEKMAQEILAYINEGMKGVNRMFDQQKMAQTVFNIAKDYTTTTMQIMKMSMEQWEKTMDALFKQGTVVQDESKKLIADWTNRAKQGQQQYWNMMDESIKKMENFVNSSDTSKRATK